jgi:hypothetical protein
LVVQPRGGTMKRFADPRAEEACGSGLIVGLPKAAGRAVHRITNVLLAAHALPDVSVLGPILPAPDGPGRFSLHAIRKWHVTFGWDQSFGAVELRLNRRK